VFISFCAADSSIGGGSYAAAGVLNLLLMVVVLVEISHRTHSSMKVCPHR